MGPGGKKPQHTNDDEGPLPRKPSGPNPIIQIPPPLAPQRASGSGRKSVVISQPGHQMGVEDGDENGVRAPKKPHSESERAATVKFGAGQLQKGSRTRGQSRQSRGRSQRRSRSRSRSQHRSRSRSRSHRRSRSRERSRSPHYPHSHHSHSHRRSQDRSHPGTRSNSPLPQRLTAKQKSKNRELPELPPSPPQTQITLDSPVHRNRPGPSSSARAKKTQNRSPETDGQEQPQEAAENKTEAIYWRHIGKLFAMERAPWVSVSGLEFACRWDSPDLPEESLMECLVEFLNNYGIKQEVRMMKTFRSEFLHGMRQLRSELVHSLSNDALEILGIDGQQSDFREGRINKKTNPGFISLRENNRFLGTGDKYLCSDQIVRGLRVALAGPGSIEVVKWTSRSRANRFDLKLVATSLHLLVATILYFLVKSHATIEGFVSGSASVYQDFWSARVGEWMTYSDQQREKMSEYLTGQVFGADNMGEDEEDYEMQMAFNEEKLKEISAGVSREEGDGERSEGPEGGGEGNVGGSQNGKGNGGDE